jgi:hypothetical protein
VCLQAWESDVESTIVSKLHSEVSQVMGSLGVSHNIERITDDGLFSADILVEDDKVIVEVDGPHHFTVNTHQPLGECPGLQFVLIKEHEHYSCCYFDCLHAMCNHIYC